jgi:branched-chain amino acid transport system ATP-binding protein
MTAVLECCDLTAGYGDTAVVRDLSFELPSGKILAILGPNGAGKTTLMLTLAGLLPRLSGEVRVQGSMLPNFRPRAANQAGVVLVPDDRALFTTLTVEENLRAATPRHLSISDDVIELFPALRERLNVVVGSLSGGEQQMLAIARALAQRPHVLLIDEMSMGLAPVVFEQLIPVIRKIADDTGAVVVLVEQHVRLALEIADEVVVLAHGQAVLAGHANELAEDLTKLEMAYLGATKERNGA